MAPRIVVMKDGKIMRIGTPKDVYENPESAFVAGFIGSLPLNFLKVELVDGFIKIGSKKLDVSEEKKHYLCEQGYVDKRFS